MSRRSKNIDGNLSTLRAKIAQLHFEKANMRLWKEKDSADAAAQIEDLKAELASLQGSLSWRLTKPLRQIASWVRSTRNSVLKRSSQSWTKDDPSAVPTALPSAIHSHGAGPVRSRDAQSETPLLDGPAAASSVRSVEPSSRDAGDFLFRGKPAWDSCGQRRLQEFLSNNRRIVFPVVDRPTVSIVIVSFNNPHLLLLSLLSIADNADVSHEVVIVDNASDGNTQKLLERVQGATIIKNSANPGFPVACMQGVTGAVGTYLCFLNNDALLGRHSLSTALQVFSDDSSVGAVGARILDPDGQLQEAGAIIWCDGTTNGYGCKDDPSQLPYLFCRPVDYCSGAFLVTQRALFNDMAGFDVDFSPGYYEDADYCMRLWSKGRRVIYEPNCIVHHYGNAGSRHKGEALSIVIRNHKEFYRRWAAELGSHYEPSGDNFNVARFAAADTHLRILAIVEEIPRRDSGKTSQEWTALHKLLTRGIVSCAATRKRPAESDYLDVDRSIELIDATTDPSSAIRAIIHDYDLFWLPSELSMKTFALAASNLDLGAEVELVLPSGVRRLAWAEFRTFFARRDLSW